MSEAADTLQSKAFLNLVDLLGEGPIYGLVDGHRSIYLNETPLQNADGTYNFEGVDFYFTEGTNDQPAVLDLTKYAETPYNVGIQVKTTTPYTFAIANPNATAVRVIMNIPGLSQTDTSSGDIYGTTVSYKFQMSVNGGPFVDHQWTGGPNITTTGKTRSKYQRNHWIELPAGAENILIRVIRLTADSTSSYLANDTYLDCYYETISNQLTYPNSAIVGISMDSQQFSSIPNRAYEVYGLKIRVPTNYNPDTLEYSGNWDGTFKIEWTRNPAWVLFDLLTNKRYGLGNQISDDMVDKAMLYRIARYCDELVPDGFGGMESRFGLDTVIASQADAYKVISDISSVFRGMSFWDGGMVNFTQDSPDDPTMIYSAANVIGGAFNYTGSARKDRHSVVHVTYNDWTDFYKKKVEYVEDAELVNLYGVKKLDTLAFGTTTRGQAARVGKWILYTEKFESDFITFKVGIDSAYVVPGNIIKIQDPNRAGKRSAGRLAGFTANSATLDNPITIDTVPATISLALEDGTFVDRTLIEGAGEHTTVTWTSALTTLPVDNALWLISEPNLVPVLGRVVGITQGDSQTEFEITAVEHNPSKFAAIEEGLVLESRPTSIIDAGFIQNPQDVNVTEATYLASANTLANKLFVSWFGNSTNYELTWRGASTENFSNITTVQVQGALTYEILNTQAGDYEITVTGINPFGKRSATVTTLFTAEGNKVLPSDVAAMTANQNANGVELAWSTISDVDLQTYEVRKSSSVGASWDSAAFVIRTTTPLLQVNSVGIGSQEWQVKAINTSGSYSLGAAKASLNVAQVPALTGVSVSAGFLNIFVQYDYPSRADFAGAKVYLSTSSGFTPAAGNLVYSGPDSLITITKDAAGNALVAGTPYYVKVAGFSRLGTSGLNYSSQFTATPISPSQVASAVLYQWAPSQPANPTGTSTFVWGTGKNYTYTGANSWVTELPANPGTPGLALWQASKQVVGTATDISATVSWSSGFEITSIGVNGTNGSAGTNAQILTMSSTGMAFTYDGANSANPTNQVVTFAANLTNISGTATFVATRYDSAGTSLGTVTLGGSGNTRTLTNTQFGAAAYCKVVATLGTLSDTITVVRLKDGAQGVDGVAGQNAVTGYLTNEAATVAANSSGTIASYAGTGGTFKVFDGLTDKTGDAAVTYSVVVGSAASLSISINAAGIYTIAALTSDTGYATLRAVYNGVTIDKVYTLARSKAGDAGAQGAAGLQSASLRLYQWAVSTPAGPAGTSTYTWATGAFTYAGGGGWTTNPGTTPSAGYTLYAATATLLDSATNLTTNVTWSSATISAVGYAGTNGATGATGPAGSTGSTGAQGASYRAAYARVASNPTPVSGNITTTGSSSFPSSAQSTTTWGFAATWAGNDPDPASVNTLYQADGIYNPATGNTVWSTPYISSLKVGTLSAITANLGTITGGSIKFATDANNYIIIDSATQNMRVVNAGVVRVKIGNLA